MSDIKKLFRIYWSSRGFLFTILTLGLFALIEIATYLNPHLSLRKWDYFVFIPILFVYMSSLDNVVNFYEIGIEMQANRKLISMVIVLSEMIYVLGIVFLNFILDEILLLLGPPEVFYINKFTHITIESNCWYVILASGLGLLTATIVLKINSRNKNTTSF
ncbi:MAG: hypothetical protein ATN36_02465 [Epulopiscium sp. Nele67-Bin005]|nr:MAG: hypothetical protein ATN36_02465 [Epulopiscium sp. Nele67-Bin005]